MRIRTVKDINFKNKLLRIYKKTIELNKKDTFFKIMSNSFKYDAYFKGNEKSKLVALHIEGYEKFGGLK